MASPEDLLAQRNKIQRQILELENTLGADSNIADLLSSSSDSENSDDSGHAGEEVAQENLEAERQQIQREIEALEQTLGVDAALVDEITDSEHGTGSHMNSSDGSDDELELPQDVETCLQMNLVYQEVIKEKLVDLERLLNENRQQQKELEAQLSGPVSTSPGLPHLKLFLGTFMKPYFKDKLTGLGPPANEETKEKLSQGSKPCDEMKIKRWEGWQKTLLIRSVVTDTMKRMLQPKMSKMDYLTLKMSKANEVEKEELKKQMALLEKEIAEISSMTEDQLYGNRHDDHDWDKIANMDFEGIRSSEDIKRFWQNYLHPSINKSTWKQDEIEKLAAVAEEYNCCHWDQIAEALGTQRTAYMCFQTYQRYIAKGFRKREWTKEEDQNLRNLVEKMRIGNFIPYTQMSYFMEGRDHTQLMYRWTSVLDPSIKKGPWSKEEDQLLRKAVEKYGVKDWWKIRLEVPGRTDNACRDRYLDCLRDDVKRGTWSDDEVELLKKQVEKYGVGKWAKIASEIPNRTDSQCLTKWRWLMRTSNNKGKRKKLPAKPKPKSKRRKMEKKCIEEEFELESSSENENIKMEYTDNDGTRNKEQDEESDFPEEDDLDHREEYVVPDMKEWIPEGGKAQKCYVKTMLVRLPTDEEIQACGENGAEDQSAERPRYTIVNHLGKPVKTYKGVEPLALNKWDHCHKNSMLKVSLGDVRDWVISMGTSALKVTNRMRSSHRLKPKVRTRLEYELMLAVVPLVGSILIPCSLSEKKVCEADVARMRSADIPFPKTPVFVFFLKALHIDAEGCKNVIEAEKNKASLKFSQTLPTKMMHQLDKQCSSVKKKPMQKQTRKQPPKKTKLQNPQQPPPTAQTTKLKYPHQNRKREIRPAVGVAQAFAIVQPNMRQGVNTPQPVGQGIPSGVQGTSQNLTKAVLQLVLTEPGKPAHLSDSPKSSSNSSSLPQEGTESTTATKRKRKPTMKAQALAESVKIKASRKRSAKKNQDCDSSPAVSVMPNTTAWILTPMGLMPVTGISLPSPGIISNNKQELPISVPQLVLQPPVIVNQQGVAGTNLDQSPKISSPPSVNNIMNVSSPVIITSSAPAKPTIANNSPLNLSANDAKPSPTVSGNEELSRPVSQVVFQKPVIMNQKGSLALINAAKPNLSTNVPPAPHVNVLQLSPSPVTLPSSSGNDVPFAHKVTPGSVVRPLTPSSQHLPMVLQTNKKQAGATTSNQCPNPLSFNSNLIFLEHPAQVKEWMQGNGGISLPQLDYKMQYLPPFVSNINTLESLLKAKECLLQEAVQLLPEEERASSEEETKIAAVRKLVSERFKTNPAYTLLKARFLSCFTLPALMATIHPRVFRSPDEEDVDEGEQVQPTTTSCNTNENEASPAQFPGMRGRK